MYMVIRRYGVPKENLKEIVSKTETGFIPALEKIPGFVDYYYSYADGFVTTVGIFKERENAEQSSRLAAEWVPKNIPGLYVGPPQVIISELVFHGHQKVSKAA